MDPVLVKATRCVGCRQCTFACAVEHSLSRDPLRALREDPPPRSRIQVRRGRSAGASAPSKCRHCSPAPCQAACPTGAIVRSAEFGLVLIEVDRCTGCASCASACPFGVVAYHLVVTQSETRKSAVKCDGCVSRLEQGRIPACAEACKSGALVSAGRGNVHPARIPDGGVAAAAAASPAGT